MKLITKLVAILCILWHYAALEAQQLWYSSPRQDYTSTFASIKSKNPVKIMHIGDSHINRGYTSRPIEEALHEKYGNQIDFVYHGINGATYSSWTSDANLARIQEEAPELLIVSLGTNDSYTNGRFSAESLRASIEHFVRSLRHLLPEVKIVLTTPPGCYLRHTRSRVVGYKKVKRRRVPIHSSTTSYTYNTHTRTAVNTIKYFGQAMGFGVIDLHSHIGAKSQCEDWLGKGLMHTDHVHFSESGYAKHGAIIAQGLIEGIEAQQ